MQVILDDTRGAFEGTLESQCSTWTFSALSEMLIRPPKVLCGLRDSGQTDNITCGLEFVMVPRGQSSGSNKQGLAVQEGEGHMELEGKKGLKLFF